MKFTGVDRIDTDLTYNKTRIYCMFIAMIRLGSASINSAASISHWNGGREGGESSFSYDKLTFARPLVFGPVTV